MKRNTAVDYMRLVAAILVVVIHTAPFANIHPLLTYSIVDVLPRIAVPFFFAISGFYFINSSAKKQLKQIFSISKIYILITAIYLLYNMVFSAIFKAELTFSITTFIFNFFITGVEYHLWFFPSLIYSMIFYYFINVLFKNKKIYWVIFSGSVILYLIGVLGCSYYKIGVNIPRLSNLFNHAYFEIVRRMILMGFAYFSSGYLAHYLNEKRSSKTSLSIFIFSVLLFLIEIYALYFLKIYDNVVITFFLYPLTVSLVWYLVSRKKSGNTGLASYCKRTSEAMYYYHPIILSILRVWNVSSVCRFLIVITVFAVAGLIRPKNIKEYLKVRNKNASIQG